MAAADNGLEETRGEKAQGPNLRSIFRLVAVFV